MSKIRILLIEDSRLLRERIVAMLNKQSDMKVVGASGGDEDPLHKARTTGAQVIIVDVSGLQRAASLTKHGSRFRVIGMGLVPGQSDIVPFIRSGASGFILKDATSCEFLSTIRSVAQGAMVLPFPLAGSLFTHVLEHARWRTDGEPVARVRMTKREREIIALLAEGFSNKEIAQRLNIATYTVKSHVHNILEKRGMHSRLEIARHALEEPRLIRVNENYLHALPSPSVHPGTFPPDRRMTLQPMGTT